MYTEKAAQTDDSIAQSENRTELRQIFLWQTEIERKCRKYFNIQKCRLLE